MGFTAAIERDYTITQSTQSCSHRVCVNVLRRTTARFTGALGNTPEKPEGGMEMSAGQERKSVICKEKKCTTGEI